ncbi:S8 family serine peptidase [Dokdonia sp. PRO95]|uniref:S8 family serine peptidase n=1 Tax=Dokdonia sp. PRO95 TaxID=1239415 RepID=UPI000557128F|nr:S8 family serine peptidase [Dokdonia sp. PRO95]
MKKTFSNMLPVLVVVFGLVTIHAQTNKKLTNAEFKQWHHADLTTDSILGISTEKAYSFLKNKKNSQVIIGVIDSGIDLKHEDLKNKIWVNPNEIVNNNIDDDKNGFIDDINGWNFAGDLTYQNFEHERILMNQSLAENKSIISKAQKTYKSRLKRAKKNIKVVQNRLVNLEKSHDAFSSHLGKPDYTLKEVLAIETTNANLNKEIETVRKHIEIIEKISQKYARHEPINIDIPYHIVNRIKSNRRELEIDSILISGNSITTDLRATLGDNLTDIKDTQYGSNSLNNNIDNEEHATHVAGIIAATRNNEKGINGITDNCLILPVRLNGADGDEHDKDVALSIRYAVDNGAKIINASIGKEFSPYKELVYESILYAAKNDVLIVIAAGNDNINLDKNFKYPNDSKNLKTEFSNNVIVVGATNSYYGENLVSIFSNYGKLNVDIFAPGNSIYATIPNNDYDFKDGTSMAAPMVAGVAGLIRSYYPSLTATQVKEIILNSGTKINMQVNAPGSYNKKVDFSDLCSSSSILNAHNAVIMADQMTNNK